MKHKLFWCAAIFLGLVIMGSVVNAQSDEYRVGCLFAVTGPASWLGEPQRNTVEMMARKINEAGGVNGRKLVLYIEDTQGDNTRAINAAKKLIKKNRVCAIIGPSRSGTSMAVIPTAETAKVPLISCASAEIMLVPHEERRWIFKVAQNDSDAVRKIYEHMQAHNIQKVGILTGTTGFGAAGRQVLKDLSGTYGIQILADETYSPADTDMTAQLIKIKNSGAQAVINWSIVPAQSIVPQNLRQLNLDLVLYQSNGFGNVKYAAAAGKSAEGTLFPGARPLAVESVSDTHPQKQVLVDYKTSYEAAYNEVASTFGSHAYDALSLIVNALKAVGDDPAKIRDHLETAEFVGTGGIFKFAPDDHCGLDKSAFEMLTVKDGKFVIYEE